MKSDFTLLKISRLTKIYWNRSWGKKKKIVAVDHLDLEIRKGEIFGFVGPNAAGKTTTLNMLVGITEPTHGTIEIFNRPFKAGDIEPLRRMGYVPEATVLPDYFTVVELLDFYAKLFSIAKKIKLERLEHLLDIVGLSEERNTLLKNLSMGQRRLVDIMQALINDPILVLLDEPTVYLDPVIMERFRSILMTLRKQGKTVIMSSHILPEVEKLADRVAIIHRGILLKVGPKEEFMRHGSMEGEFLRLVKDIPA